MTLSLPDVGVDSGLSLLKIVSALSLGFKRRGDDAGAALTEHASASGSGDGGSDAVTDGAVGDGAHSDLHARTDTYGSSLQVG
jgi:hypothetical protein